MSGFFLLLSKCGTAFLALRGSGWALDVREE